MISLIRLHTGHCSQKEAIRLADKTRLSIQREKVEFYDPHPGLGGALVPLPTNMRRLAQYFDGKQEYLEDAVKQIQEEAKRCGGDARAVESHHYVEFAFRTGPQAHHFRLLRYRRLGNGKTPMQLDLPFER